MAGFRALGLTKFILTCVGQYNHCASDSINVVFISLVCTEAAGHGHLSMSN